MVVFRPVSSPISKRVYRHSSQSVCPWNVKFTTELREPAFAPCDLVAERASRDDSRALAREILMMEPVD